MKNVADFPVPGEQAPVSISLLCRKCDQQSSLTYWPWYHSLAQPWSCPLCGVAQTVYLQGRLVS